MRRRPIMLAGLVIAATAGIVAPATAGASAVQSAPQQASNCYGYDFPDNGLEYCVYPAAKSGECLITEKRTTFIGTETRCVQRRP
jgi:hypothetical protein